MRQARARPPLPRHDHARITHPRHPFTGRGFPSQESLNYPTHTHRELSVHQPIVRTAIDRKGR